MLTIRSIFHKFHGFHAFHQKKENNNLFISVDLYLLPAQTRKIGQNAEIVNGTAQTRYTAHMSAD